MDRHATLVSPWNLPTLHQHLPGRHWRERQEAVRETIAVTTARGVVNKRIVTCSLSTPDPPSCLPVRFMAIVRSRQDRRFGRRNRRAGDQRWR